MPVQDLSHLAEGSLAVSAMSGGNTVSSNEAAMTAPGSPPVDKMPNQSEVADPSLTITGSPRSVAIHPPDTFTPAAVTWKDTPNPGAS